MIQFVIKNINVYIKIYQALLSKFQYIPAPSYLENTFKRSVYNVTNIIIKLYANPMEGTKF